MNKNNKHIKESVITNLKTLGQLPADEAQLNIDVLYNSILDEVVAIVPMESPRQVVFYLALKYGMPKKSTNQNIKQENKDVVNTTMINSVGASPLDENGYITNKVVFETKDSEFIGAYKNIIPSTVEITDTTGKVIIVDDGEGSLVKAEDGETSAGTVDYNKALFNCTVSEVSQGIVVNYEYDIYNVDTSRNLVYFQKVSKEVFADQYQLDVDVAFPLYGMKSLDIEANINKLLPEVLAQQIDQNILSRYFDQLELSTTHKVTWDAGVDWNYEQSATTVSATELLKDFGTLVNVEIGAFAKRTGVVPNVIICDPMAYGVLKNHRNFRSLENVEDVDMFSGMPKKVGIFDGFANVFVTKTSNSDVTKGQVILTYRGPKDSRLAAGVYTPFIPVTVRTEDGVENAGMIRTTNVYSLGGFTITNPDLISGIEFDNLTVLSD